MSVSEIDLSIYGIENQKKIFHNLSYDELYEHETNPTLKGFEVVEKTALGAVNVDTGKFTGRSPKDKYIVKDEATEENVWWWRKDNRSDNKPISQEVWDELLEITQKQLSHKSLYVVDAFCGANKNSRLKIRVVTEVAWQAHFVKNMFIRPTEEELKDFTPDFVMLNSCKTINEKWKEQALNSEVYVAFNISKGMTIIGGTWYGGEMKKGFFSIMNYFLPLRGIASMHCSANQGIKEKDTALFFGLSGTGKTTLSTDPDRLLIGDDEHGWDDDGIFNFEGGCYAKCIDLSKEQEPDIYAAIRRDALLENVAIDKDGNPDFCCSEKTENTRVSYPIYHINNIVKPVSKGTHPKNIIFLTADAFGIFPPVSKLTKEQAMYYFLSGYTAKLAGTELGIKEPVPTFSPAFGAPFLLLHPTVYAQVLAEKMEEHGSNAFLVNTGYARGPYGIGKRMRLSTTRSIINAIHSGEINTCEYVKLQPFGLWIPTHLPSSKSELLNPRDTWDDKDFYDRKAIELAELFIDNFKKFRDNDIAKKIESAGPQL